MGYNTTILILNDAMDQILEHPEEFVRGIRDTMLDGGEIGVGYFGNAAQVMPTTHADVERLYLTHGNWISEFGFGTIEPRLAPLYRLRLKWARSLLDRFEGRLRETEEKHDRLHG